jgi:hypothetical protein
MSTNLAFALSKRVAHYGPSRKYTIYATLNWDALGRFERDATLNLDALGRFERDYEVGSHLDYVCNLSSHGNILSTQTMPTRLSLLMAVKSNYIAIYHFILITHVAY